MSRLLILLGLWSSLFGAEILFYPLDWSGQLGMMTSQGQHLWRSGWQSGVLIIDPVYGVYPARYGQRYHEDSGTINPLPEFAFPADSLATVSQLDYSRGDYEYNTLELTAGFPGEKRYLKIHGFKRTYLGQYAQFLPPDNKIRPLQQSYRFDYQSQSGHRRTSVSIGKYITDAGVVDTLGAQHSYREDITVGGLNFFHDGPRFPLAGYLYFNVRKWSHPSLFLPVSGTHYSSWAKTGWQLSLRPVFSLNMDTQKRLITARNKKITAQIWHSVFIHYQTERINMELGSVINDQQLFPLGSADIQLPWRSFTLAMNARSSWQPVNPVLQDLTGITTGEQTGSLSVQLNQDLSHVQWDAFLKTITIAGYVDGTHLIDTLRREETISDIFFGANADMTWSRYAVTMHWSHSRDISRLSLGYQDWFQIRLRYRWDLFGKNLSLTAESQFDQIWGRNDRVQIDPFIGIPFERYRPGVGPVNPWFIHFRFIAQVSTFTLIWSVNHAAFATRDIWKSEADTLARDVVFMRTNPLLDPAGQLIRFEVIWNFID